MNKSAVPPDPGPRNRSLHLSSDQLEQIAAGESTDTHANCIDHLDSCEYCRQQLTKIAADELFWRKSADLLQSRDPTEELCSTTDRDLDVRQAPADEAVTLIVRSLLGPTEQDDSIGRLGRFEVLGIIGSGGMGVVLKCRDVDIDRVVAIKIPSAHLWRSPAALETLEREARSAASVVHPHVISIYQVDRWRQVPYLVMPYFSGPSLDRRISRSGPLRLDAAIRITRQMAEALAAAHACGVIHRDVKPGNILLGHGVERAVLCDFGLAKVQSDATFTASGSVAGTPAYLSPEQATGQRVGPSSDLFSLGSVLWTMLTGRVPWAGLHPHAIVNRIASGEMPPMEVAEDQLLPWVPRLLACIHRRDPVQRLGSAAELVEILKACERHMADPDAHPLPPRLQPAEPAHNRRRRVGPVAVAALLLISSSTLLAIPLWRFSFGSIAPADVVSPNATAEMPVEALTPPTRSSSLVADLTSTPDAGDSPGADASPEAVGEMLDEIEASMEQVLSDLQTLEDSN